jgi:hypothetical protein
LPAQLNHFTSAADGYPPVTLSGET